MGCSNGRSVNINTNNKKKNQIKKQSPQNIKKKEEILQNKTQKMNSLHSSVLDRVNSDNQSNEKILLRMK